MVLLKRYLNKSDETIMIINISMSSTDAGYVKTHTYNFILQYLIQQYLTVTFDYNNKIHLMDHSYSVVGCGSSERYFASNA